MQRSWCFSRGNSEKLPVISQNSRDFVAHILDCLSRNNRDKSHWKMDYEIVTSVTCANGQPMTTDQKVEGSNPSERASHSQGVTQDTKRQPKGSVLTLCSLFWKRKWTHSGSFKSQRGIGCWVQQKKWHCGLMDTQKMFSLIATKPRRQRPSVLKGGWEGIFDHEGPHDSLAVLPRNTEKDGENG